MDNIDKAWANFSGKNVLVVFDDGGSVSMKKGILHIVGDSFLELTTLKTTELIPIKRIIRIQLIQDTAGRDKDAAR